MRARKVSGRKSGCELLALQGTYAGLPDFLTQVVESELARIPRAFARSHPDLRWTIVYLPQVPNLLDSVDPRLLYGVTSR